MQENSSEKVFSQRSQISVDKRSRQWPVWNDLKSQDAAPKQKQQTFPVKKKRLWLNCYSLSDHHNESTTRRWSKRKSEEHPVYINCVCVRPFILHQFPLCLPWRTSRCHTDLLLSPRPWVCLGKQQVIRQDKSAKLLDWDADKSFLGNILEIKIIFCLNVIKTPEKNKQMVPIKALSFKILLESCYL